MKYRKLRIAWSVAWGIVAVLLIVLWVRSYWWIDGVEYPKSPLIWEVTSMRGQILISKGQLSAVIGPPPVQRFYTERVSYYDTIQVPLYLGLHVYRTATSLFIFAPDWFPALVVATLAALPWLSRWSNRFSLRTLLIATMLVAVGLGLIAWSING